MPIEKPMEPMTENEIMEEFGSMDPDALVVDIEPPEGEEDGSVEVMLGPDDPDTISEDVAVHGANLAEFIDETDLARMGSELLEGFEADKMSRHEWARTYVEGLDMLGMKIEERTEPWKGASGVVHPMLAEAVIRFQAQAMGEIYPATGPARTKIVGKETPEVAARAKRVEQELNYQLTEEMPEYREEMEQMLFHLPLAGSAFKKVYHDPVTDRAVAAFVKAEDFVVSYGASDLHTCERYTHVMRKTETEILGLQAAGFYRDIDLPPAAPEMSDIQEKYDEMSGEESVMQEDDRHTLLEMHVTMLMPEGIDDDPIPRPYVVTIDKTSREILSIRRNWYEDDARKIKRMHFVHYRYLPGVGFYGTGLVHIIGGLSKSATSLMRQLIDAGTLSNLPAGLKTRGLRIKGDNTPLKPGEWRDVDVTGGTPLRESLYGLPYKEPSGVLYQLLGNVVEEGRRIGSVADLQVGNMSADAPVGTTLALLERSMKVMSGVQARLHASLKKELRLISGIIRDFMGPEYAFDVGGDFNRTEDFAARVSVIPVSDPNATTMAQRVVQYQAAVDLASRAPQLYNMGLLHRKMLEVLGIEDAAEIVALPGDIKPKDPVSENMAILKQEAVKAFAYQDHEAHIAVHMAAAQDPKIQQMVGQSPFAAAIQSAMAAHITEHVAMQYRVDIQRQMGVEMPDENEPLPEDVERALSTSVAEAAAKLLQKHQVEAAAAEAEAEAQNPLTQIQMAELEIKKRGMDLKEQIAQHEMDLEKAKLALDTANKTANVEVQQRRIQSEEQRAGASLGVKLVTETASREERERARGIELGERIAEKIVEGAKGENS